MKKIRWIGLLLAILVLTGILPVSAASAGYSDVPSGFWAETSILQATQLGIISGVGGGRFGLGQQITRGQFVTMLVRLFEWKTVATGVPAFSDVENPTEWYYPMVQTAVANGAIPIDSDVFRPEEGITRQEMAVMLVRALGYDGLAKDIATTDLPFVDVTANRGHIALAHRFGIIHGVSDTAFSPSGYATREQAAAMMVRLYNRSHAQPGWRHAFYAISSFPQASRIPLLDAVTFGWSRLQYAEETGVLLNMTTSDANDFYLPTGYSSVVGIAKEGMVPMHLNVYMDTSQIIKEKDGSPSNVCRKILLSQQNRNAAISQILSKLQQYPFLSGITIDFEGLRGPDLKTGLTTFMQELRTALDGTTGMDGATLARKTVFLCVPPVTSDGIYFDGYDYPALGDICDRIILMAHDYQATGMSPEMMAAGFTVTPLTPIAEIQYALAAITDQKTGVQDTSKVALAISFQSAQWQLRNNRVINSTPYHPHTDSIAQRLLQPDTVLSYAQRYENAYMTFQNSTDGTHNVVWYEDERSVAAKLKLARLFGIRDISIWRLGLIPDVESPAEREIHYGVMDLLLGE